MSSSSLASWFYPTLSLPQNDYFYQRAERELQTRAWQLIYSYSKVEGLPMPMAPVTSAVVNTFGVKEVEWVGRQAQNNFEIDADLEKFKQQWIAKGSPTRFASTADFADLFATYPKPRVVEDWTSDASFANQRVAGLNPMALNRVTSDGSRIGLDWTTLRGKLSPRLVGVMADALPNGIEEAIATKRLYAADYVDLKEVGVTGENAPGAQKGRELMAPIGFFYRGTGQGLAPIGVQLDQSVDSPWATPATSAGTTWDAAKVYYQAADVSLNQIVNHLGMTHLIQSAFAVASARQLAKQHPLNALLAPHHVGLLQINALGEKTLLAPGGVVDQILEPGLAGGLLLIEAAYERWRFFDLEPDADLAKRGLDDTAALPYCPYRDDGTLIWALIGDYVKDYLEIFYGNPATDPDKTLRAIREDYELQAWANELSRESMGPGNVPGFPRRIDDFETLYRIVRLLIWIAGPRHASVNFPQIEYTGFVPNQPTAIYLLPDAKSANFILDMMPPVEASKTEFQVSFQLAGLHFDQLLDYAGNFEGDGPNILAKSTVTRYKQKLDGAISDEINRRNAERQSLSLLSYPYFLPKNIPNGTSV